MTVLPPGNRKQIEVAMANFDKGLRSSAEWSQWQANAAQKFALTYEGRLYPPKKIISLATGVPVSDFYGGYPSNSYLENMGFDVVPLERPEISETAPSFEIGRVYDRWPEINDPYGGSRQSGISASRKSDAIFLFTGESGQQYGYKDHFDERGVFWYSGEGQAGDMKLDKGNRAIVDHAKDGRALHVFETQGKAMGQKYLGEFTYASHEFQKGSDKKGRQRSVIIFHLVPVSLLADDLSDVTDEEFSQESLDQARKRALAGFEPHEQQGTSQAQRALYRRSKAVRDYVLLRANGHCESCKALAPFKRLDGRPYLEPHHTTRVSDGGLDHPRHVGAVCPTCHREIHYGISGTTRNADLVQYLGSIESDK
jgi:5-methylcytosine-specific restriction protein A